MYTLSLAITLIAPIRLLLPKVTTTDFPESSHTSKVKQHPITTRTLLLGLLLLLLPSAPHQRFDLRLTFFSSVIGVGASRAGSMSLFFLFLSFFAELSTVGVATAGVAAFFRGLTAFAGVMAGGGVGGATGDCSVSNVVCEHAKRTAAEESSLSSSSSDSASLETSDSSIG